MHHQPASSLQMHFHDKIFSSINQRSNDYFDLYDLWRTWDERKAELDFQYREYATASSSRKVGWVFLLFVLVPLTALFDYTSIASFIAFLSASAGGVLGSAISVIGWLFFVMLELATGWVIVYYAKDKPLVKWFAVLLAIGLIVTPSYLIYTTYDISAHKTTQLLHKTTALIIISLIIHAIFFLVIAEVWAAIFHLLYTIKRAWLSSKDPRAKMKVLKKRLQSSYNDFDQYSRQLLQSERAQLLTNISWYVKQKITNSRTPYDLSDFDSTHSYAPPLLVSSNGMATANR